MSHRSRYTLAILAVALQLALTLAISWHWWWILSPVWSVCAWLTASVQILALGALYRGLQEECPGKRSR